MVFRNFRINIIIRLLFILAGLVLIALWITGGHYLRAAYIAIILIGLLIELFLYIDRQNRNVANFFSALLHDDYSQHLTHTGKGKSFRLLFKTLNALNDNLTGHTQTNTRTFILRRIKRHKNLIQDIFWNTLTVIPDNNTDLMLLRPGNY